MDTTALFKLSYGLYIITSKKGDKINGQIANTAFQISNSPATIAVSINKQNLTNEFIRESGVFAVSVLDSETPLSFVGQFGFKSGRDTDKFADVMYKLGTTGAPYVTQNTLAYMEAKVIQEVDANSHTIFIGEMVGAEILRDGVPMTYDHYQKVKRGSVSPASPTFNAEAKKEEKKVGATYTCALCGYIYDPANGDPYTGAAIPFEELPADWICPICGVEKNTFLKNK